MLSIITAIIVAIICCSARLEKKKYYVCNWEKIDMKHAKHKNRYKFWVVFSSTHVLTLGFLKLALLHTIHFLLRKMREIKFFISLLIILSWMIFPNTVLFLFLIVASFHFGKEDTVFSFKRRFLISEWIKTCSPPSFLETDFTFLFIYGTIWICI